MECTQWQHNYFVTLTYNDNHVPLKQGLNLATGEWQEELTVSKPDVQQFMKNLRRHFDHHYGETNIRYYCSAEYGDETERPHYHICLFNCNIRDLKEYPKKNDLGDQYYTSKTLEDIWKKGNVIIGELTSMSAGYTARYVMKKWKGKNGAEKWAEAHIKEREFSLMSRKPGIGAEYFEQHKEKMIRDGFILVPALEGAYKATTPKSFVYKHLNPGLTAKDSKMRVSEEEDKHNRELRSQLRRQKEEFSNAITQSKLATTSLDYESIIKMENESFERKIMALRQKGMS